MVVITQSPQKRQANSELCVVIDFALNNTDCMLHFQFVDNTFGLQLYQQHGRAVLSGPTQILVNLFSCVLR